MIALHKNRIRWEPADIVTMSRILGSEDAVKGWCPPLPSVLRLVDKKGIPMTDEARTFLRAETERRKVRRLLEDTDDAEIDDPRAKKYFAHQRADLRYIYDTNLPAYLIAHETGVGKTLEAIRFGEFREAKRIAVITPNAAKDQWRDEIIRWRTRKLPIRIVEGSGKEQTHTLRSMKTGWAIGHWESLVHARDGWLDDQWDLIIMDEAQHIQNRHAKRTETLMAMQREAIIALTAHPFANAVDELFPILQALYPGLYPSFWRWAHMHIKIEALPFGGLNLSEPRRPKLLAWEIAPFMLRRSKRSVWKNLPPVVRLPRYVTLRPSARAEYMRLRKQFFVELKAHEGERRILAIPSVLARIMRMRQYLIDPGILGGKEPSPKYPEVLTLLEEIGKPTVIFTAFREVADRLAVFLRKHKKRVDCIVGGQRKRTKPIKKKFLRGELDAVIIVIAVGGSALNFGKYGYYIVNDLPWNPRDYEQIEGRVDRPEEGTGKMVPATGFRILVKDSYEEKMESLVSGKHGDFTKVFTVNTIKQIFSEDPDGLEDDE